MFPSTNFGFDNNNGFNQGSFPTQQTFQDNSLGQMQSNFQAQPMNNFYQPGPDAGSMMQGNMMDGGYMQNNSYGGFDNNSNSNNSNGGMMYQQENQYQTYSPEHGMNQQNDLNNTTSVYTPFDQLPNFDENIDMNNVVESMKMLFADKSQWKSKFDAIDNLRILNKYHVSKMNEIIQLFGENILECFESQKTCIAKNILMFSSEVFMNAREVRIQDDIVSFLIPQVLSKSTSEKSILKKEAETGLLFLIQHCLYDCTIITLAKTCFEKSPSLCEHALLILSKVVGAIGNNLPAFKYETLQVLMLTLGKLMDSAKKGNMKTGATELCVNMYARFGRENYQELVLTTVAKTHPELLQFFEKAVEKAMEDKKGKKTMRESSLKAFVQEQKQNVRMSNIYMAQMQNMNSTNVLGQSFDPNFGQQQQQQLHYQDNQMPFMSNMQGGYQDNSYMNGQVNLNFPQNY